MTDPAITDAAPSAEPTPPPGSGEGPSLRSRAIRGSTWTLFGHGSATALRLAVNIVLTHLLFPSTFGLMQLVTVVLAAVQMFSDIGIGPSIIQNPRGEEAAFRNTAWTVQVIRGAGLWLVTSLVAWPASIFYGQPEIVQVLPVLAAVTVINGFCSTATVLLNRRMQIGRLAIFELVVPLPGLALMCVLAAVWHTIWAIVVGQLVSSLVRTVASHLVLIPGHRDRFRWDPAAATELFRFGRWVFVSTMVTFLSGQIDKLMLGKLVSLDELGIYGIALALALMPQDLLNRLATAVQFPALSASAGGGPERLAKWLKHSRAGLLSMGLTMSLGVALGAPTFFAVLYDSRYVDGGWIAQMISVSIWIAMLQVTCDRVLLAQGDSRTLAYSNVAKLMTSAAACLIGFKVAGLPGFLVGLSVGSLAGYLCITVALHRQKLVTLGADLAYSLVFGATLGGSWLLAKQLSWMGTWRRVDLGWLTVSVLVLPPLGAWAAHRLYRLVVSR